MISQTITFQCVSGFITCVLLGLSNLPCLFQKIGHLSLRTTLVIHAAIEWRQIATAFICIGSFEVFKVVHFMLCACVRGLCFIRYDVFLTLLRVCFDFDLKSFLFY